MTWTIDGLAEHESVIKHSVFRTRAVSVDDEKSALTFLDEVADPDATHNCWAFKIGGRFRVSDDGEPSGTAGRPILSAIEGQDFDHVMVVVTRWFGGIKLGAGGLVRAYGGAAAACLREAEKIERIERIMLSFHCPFSIYAEIEAKLPQWQVEIRSCDFDAEGAALLLALPLIYKDDIANWLRDMTRGQKPLTFLEEENF
ncbi:IMPACT family protein [Aristophania vespae]|uniref:IMPACT family protein n=1 Tax=Aristophania vespae TaxID=2697033 RepID=UPI002351920B|nr:YigZ family protein [Aristophania vespae]UMM63964.1 IMPACT family member YigZ [Aristophania vespae]